MLMENQLAGSPRFALEPQPAGKFHAMRLVNEETLGD